MKIAIHDYVGHPFQVHLSRNLAQRGHDVFHIYCVDHPGPKAAFARADDSPALNFVGISLGRQIEQTALIKRRFADLEYGKRAAEVIRRLNPDAVISGNTPTEAQHIILKACKRNRIRFVYWVQDFYSIAVAKLLAKRNRVTGALIGGYYHLLDRRQFQASDAIVVISEDFAPLAASWAGDAANVTVIENWAALADIPIGPKDNPWSRHQNLHDLFTFIYSGTLGRKHRPELLVKLVQDCCAESLVAVVGQGVGMSHLATVQAAEKLEALKLLPLQPIDQLANVLATADVLVAMIDTDAGTFAVPSKVQSYLCAGRPILLAAPKENLAARTVLQAQAGIVVDPADPVGFCAAARRLRRDPDLRATLGANGRAYAERVFDLTKITDQFEDILAVGKRPECLRIVNPTNALREAKASA